ncbi:MAG: signal recognition particle-docking protein FtsY [Bdellovibrionota bacterium]|nr:signal recognition particle-docking protein FtsY [Pseudomonadota bacterium]MDY6089646.1 signal recognition particle-docking protein FtsY [Bdellovibrionota bacterium]
MLSHNLNSFFEKVLPYIDNSENLIEIVCAIIIIFAMIFVSKRKGACNCKSKSCDVKASLYGRLRKSREGFLSKINDIFSGNSDRESILNDLEELLISSDVGAETSMFLCNELKDEFKTINNENKQEVIGSLKNKIIDILGDDEEIKFSSDTKVIMVVGVNGVGKTTTIAKLADKWIKQGKKVLLVAGDTFRAAASEQLAFWAQKVGADIVKGKEGDKPSTVVFDAMKKVKEQAFDVVIIDTAGRLHNKSNLMQELSGIQNAVTKNINRDIDEVILVVDGTSGQNALMQAKEFNNVVTLTGLIITKLDGTPKGGILIAIKRELKTPVYYVGIGEGSEDLINFNAKDFASALLDATRPTEREGINSKKRKSFENVM